ncbi:TonB-dependent receptor plug domain-containing protein [Granulosicoccus antarcticus]|uniref:Colicin I receptor n=1 Tax=Granulosicoccus antarcticus IMCC3135 TaxID=1192854 RepID=A0A2Z2NIB8_9GAMM|nr:TonB-dependent receptor [Granulosicoccus antarcticus]ASJ70803.1 Colicin I receptor [Granulosicoccus antarcticus IMCC3135]
MHFLSSFSVHQTAWSITALYGFSAFISLLHAHDELELFDSDVPIVLSASRLTQPISSAPASMTVIDAEMIRLSGARSIVDILRLVPGFQIGRLVNGNPVATYNGIAERYNPRLQLVIDGRPTYVPLYGGIPWSELPIALTDIERVEVTRGPNAATFGPNSFGAVVSITTRAPASRSGWYLNSEAGGNEFRSGTLSYHGSGDNSHYRVTIQNERDEGFRNIPDKERSALLSISTHWQISPIDSLSVDLGGIRGGHTEVDTVVEENDLNSYSEATNAYTQFVWEHSHSADDALRVQYYYNYFDIQDDNTTTFNLDEVFGNPDFAGLTVDAPINRDSNSTRHEIEAQKTKRLSERHRIVFGGALRQDSVQGHYIFNDELTRTVSTQRVFAHSEFNINPEWLLNSGLLVEKNSISDISTSPRLSLTHRYAPGKMIRLGYSRGTRTPLLLEEEGQVTQEYMISNGDVLTDRLILSEGNLEPETIDVIDLGYYYNNPGQNLSIDAKLSYHEIRDTISTLILRGVDSDNFDQAARTYSNRFDYTYSTAELQIERKLSHQIRLRAAYSHTFDQDADLSRRKLIPGHTLSLFGSVGLAREFTLSTEFYHSGTWIWDDVSKVESKVNRLDFRLEKNLKLASMNITLALQAELDMGGTTDYLYRNQLESLYFARLNVQLP